MGEYNLARLIFKSNGVPYEDEKDEKPSIDIFAHTDEALCVLMAQLGMHIEDEGVNPLDIIPKVVR